MKKALITANLTGFVNFLLSDMDILTSMGYHVDFAAKTDLPPEAEEFAELKKRGIAYHPIGFSAKDPFSKDNLRAFLQMRKLLQKENYTLIHCHTPITAFFTRLAAQKYRRKNKTKVIYTSHGFAFTKNGGKIQNFLYRTAETFASLYTDMIITINEEDFLAAKKFPCRNVRKISGVGVDSERFHRMPADVQECKKALGLPEDKHIILSVGEISERKNHQVIIRAIGRIENKQDYLYVICGRKTELSETLQRLAEKEGVSLRLMGHRKDIPLFMHCAELCALPSIREGLGMAGIESLCAGTPVIGTDIQGIREYIKNGETGYLCEASDAEAFANAIRRITENNEKEKKKTL